MKAKEKVVKIDNPYRTGLTIKGLDSEIKFSVAEYLKSSSRVSIFLSLFNK